MKFNLGFYRQCMSCGALLQTTSQELSAIGCCPECGDSDAFFEDVPSEVTLEWMLARLRRLEAEAAASEASYKEVLQLLGAQKERSAKKLAYWVGFITPWCQKYLEANPPPKGKKSIVVAGTTIGYRGSPAAWQLDESQGETEGLPDSEELHPALKWAMDKAPELVKTTVELRWKGLKDRLGEMAEKGPVTVPGVVLAVAKETFFVRSNKP